MKKITTYILALCMVLGSVSHAYATPTEVTVIEHVEFSGTEPGLGSTHHDVEVTIDLEGSGFSGGGLELGVLAIHHEYEGLVILESEKIPFDILSDTFATITIDRSIVYYQMTYDGATDVYLYLKVYADGVPTDVKAIYKLGHR